jgi:hypothetical protein
MPTCQIEFVSSDSDIGMLCAKPWAFDIPLVEAYVDCHFRRTGKWTFIGSTPEGVSARRLPRQVGTLSFSEGIALLYMCIPAEVNSSFKPSREWGLRPQGERERRVTDDSFAFCVGRHRGHRAAYPTPMDCPLVPRLKSVDRWDGTRRNTTRERDTR